FFQTKHQSPVPSTPTREISSLYRLPASFSLPSLRSQLKWSAPPEGRDEEQIEFSWAGETARHVGTLVHRWLQRMAQDDLRDWDAKRIDSLVGTFGRELRRRGVRDKDARPAADLVRAALANALVDERGAWLLGPHPEARSEYRLRVRTPEGVRTYVLDRHFRTREGEW